MGAFFEPIFGTTKQVIRMERANFFKTTLYLDRTYVPSFGARNRIWESVLTVVSITRMNSLLSMKTSPSPTYNVCIAGTSYVLSRSLQGSKGLTSSVWNDPLILGLTRTATETQLQTMPTAETAVMAAPSIQN